MTTAIDAGPLIVSISATVIATAILLVLRVLFQTRQTLWSAVQILVRSRDVETAVAGAAPVKSARTAAYDAWMRSCSHWLSAAEDWRYQERTGADPSARTKRLSELEISELQEALARISLFGSREVVDNVQATTRLMLSTWYHSRSGEEVDFGDFAVSWSSTLSLFRKDLDVDDGRDPRLPDILVRSRTYGPHEDAIGTFFESIGTVDDVLNRQPPQAESALTIWARGPRDRSEPLESYVRRRALSRPGEGLNGLAIAISLEELDTRDLERILGLINEIYERSVLLIESASSGSDAELGREVAPGQSLLNAEQRLRIVEISFSSPLFARFLADGESAEEGVKGLAAALKIVVTLPFVWKDARHRAEITEAVARTATQTVDEEVAIRQAEAREASARADQVELVNERLSLENLEYRNRIRVEMDLPAQLTDLQIAELDRLVQLARQLRNAIPGEISVEELGRGQDNLPGTASEN